MCPYLTFGRYFSSALVVATGTGEISLALGGVGVWEWYIPSRMSPFDCNPCYRSVFRACFLRSHSVEFNILHPPPPLQHPETPLPILGINLTLLVRRPHDMRHLPLDQALRYLHRSISPDIPLACFLMAMGSRLTGP